MQVFNLATGELGREDGDFEGWRGRSQRIGEQLGGEDIGGTVYDVEAGQRSGRTTTTTESRSGWS